MNKKLIALAVAGAFAAPAVALAQGTNVTLYGQVNPAFENYRVGNSTSGAAVAGGVATQTAAQAAASASTPNRNRVVNNTSFIGVKGTEDLGGGLKAIFQVESNVFPDGPNNVSSTATAANAALGSRNTQAGLTGAWGTVFLGNWDTPFKFVTNRDPFGGSTADGAQLFGNAVASNHSNVSNTTSFFRRQNNTLAYWTPDMSGFQARIHYAADEEAATTATGTNDPRLWSVSGTYTNGPLYVGLAYERHVEYQTGVIAGSTVNGTDTAWGLAANYTFGNTTLGAIYTRLRYEAKPTAAGANTGNVDQNNWQLSVMHKVTPAGTIKVAYTKAGSASGSCSGPAAGGACVLGQIVNTSDAGARMWAVGYDHAFSKRTTAYAYYLDLNNDNNGIYAPFGGVAATVPGAGSTTALGADHRVLGLGLKHTF